MPELNNDLTQKFSKTTILIHWLTALLILILFPMGKYMEGLELVEKMGMLKLHIGLGLVVLLLTLVRTFSFFKHKRPAAIKTGSIWNDNLAVWIHNLFYFLLFAITLSGIATMLLGGYVEVLKTGDLAAQIKEEFPPLKAHGLLAVIMMLLFVLHVIGVLKHYISTKENTLKRIF